MESGPMSRTMGAGSADCEYYNNKFKGRRIIFFSTDIDSENSEDTFVFMAQMAKKMGHDVIIVTTNCARKIMESHLRSMKVYQIGQLIPKCLFGTFYLPLYYLRTIYSSLWLLRMKKNLNPSFVVVRNTNAVVPFLKLVGKLHIVQIHTFTDIELIAGSPDEVILRGRKFHQFCVQHADEIVVQNKLSRAVFKKLFAKTDKLPAVLYPCVDTSTFERCRLAKLKNVVRIPDDAIVFVSFGPLRRSSNFELLIDAFALLLDQVQSTSPYVHFNLYLVIAGHYEDTQEYTEYSTELQYSSLKLCHERPNVLFLNAISLTYRKALINRCEAVLYPMLKSLDGRSILEAGLMKKPVLAANSGIAAELIKDGVNGFLVSPDPENFSRCMHSLVYNRQQVPQRSKAIYNYFKKNYSKLRYSCDLQNIITRNSRHVVDSSNTASSSSVFRV